MQQNGTVRDITNHNKTEGELEKKQRLNRLLVDTKGMKLASSLMAVYDLPTKQYLEMGADKQGRVAIVPPTCPKTNEAIQFYETVCRNRGWMVRVFSEALRVSRRGVIVIESVYESERDRRLLEFLDRWANRVTTTTWTCPLTGSVLR